jgi:LPS export ABC transporter protein LptC
MLPYIQNKNITELNRVLSISLLRTFVYSFTALFLMSCSGNSLQEIDELMVESETLPLSTSKNVVLNFSDSGIVKIILSAPILERFIDEDAVPYDVLSEGMKIEFVDSLGNVEAKVLSKYAIHYPNKDILELSNDVQVYNLDGDKLNSEHLTWNSRTKKIQSDDFVKITTADEIIYGDGFEANQDFTNYRINHIKGIISLDNESIQ